MDPSMSRIRPRFVRGITALVCAQLLLTACSAQAITPAADGALWPTPRPQPEPPRILPWRQPAPVVTVPNFEAPSAQSCARPIVTREVPGPLAQQVDKRTVRPHGRPSPAEARESARADAAAPRAAPEAPVLSTPAAAPFAEKSAAGSAGAEGRAWPAPASPPVPPSPLPQRQRAPVVTAGMVDDNADFGAYLAFRERTQVAHRARDVSERHLLQVRDRAGRPVPDAEVAVRSPQGYAMWARTDTAGRAWIHPNAFDPGRADTYEVAVRQGGREVRSLLRRSQKSAVDVTLPTASVVGPARLDLVFLIDATGSMADEIGKLKASLASIATDVARLPSRPDLCFGLVAYRDKGDAFMLRSHDFTHDLNAFQDVLDALRADGGGDYPEAMNEALHETVHNLSWRGNGATRMVVLLADAPPHLDYGGPQYDDDMAAALGKGIKMFSVGASGLDKQGEYIQRQIAQYTGGRFVFLTYADAARPERGPGRETVHDVDNYSVDTLDQLIVRLVTEELAKLPKG